MIITRKTEDVSRELTRVIRALKGLGEAVTPLIEQVVSTAADRPWWDFYGKLFSRKRDMVVAVAGIGTAEGLATLIARLESMKSLCDNYGATEVQVSHEDMYHITGASALVERINAGLEEMFDDGSY